MFHVRVVCPPAVTRPVTDYLRQVAFVINVVHLPGAAQKPDGDLLLFDVAREECSVVLARLVELGCERRGSIAVVPLEVSLSDAAERAERSAEGSPADAVLWEQVTARTSESSELSVAFALFMVLATTIAAAGILTDSMALIIGAMVVGPEFGPIAGVCVALVQRRFGLAVRSSMALVVGFPLGVVSAYVFTLGLRACGLTPPTLEHGQTMFISHPDAYSVIIALLAGVAGMFSLTTAKAGALIGVFISITTIPAAANIGVALAYRDANELRGASTQLALNLAMLLVAGTLTLAAQRLAFAARRNRDRRRAAVRRRAGGATG